jgi:hypothetical protein
MNNNNAHLHVWRAQAVPVKEGHRHYREPAALGQKIPPHKSRPQRL